jgi:putative CocE/NonD family hydrolase
MRDGTVLRADVYRPTGEGRYPVIVERVAYELVNRTAPYAEFYASRGYVFVGQNTRGSFWSEGQFTVARDDGWGDRKDGYDTIEWCAEQPWSNGRIGTMDGSWSGLTQYLLAPTRPPHLVTMFVRQGPSGLYPAGGIRSLAMARMFWIGQFIERLKHESAPAGSRHRASELEKAVADGGRIFQHLPAGENPWLDDIAPFLKEDVDHPDYGPYWSDHDTRRMAHEIDVPVFHLAGWYDSLLPSSLAMYEGIRRRGLTQATREGQRLLVGPWIHGPMAPDRSVAGELDHGPEASLGLNEFRLRWFDFWLKGEKNAAMDGAPVRVFLMGANRWLDLTDWPPPGVTYTPMYLRAGIGRDGASLNNGTLSFEQPQEDEPPDSFEYDPSTAVPTVAMTAKQQGAPADHRPIEGRLLTYSSAVLEEDLAVVGPIRMVLFATSDCPDTDWFVRLLDVWPAGRSLNVQRGSLRARYRGSLESPELMQPGRVYRFDIDVSATAQVFKAGHRIRVHVTSSEFPPFERNMNTGGVNARESTGRVAQNAVIHSRGQPSHIVLPILGRV